jgi:hypothetical protein
MDARKQSSARGKEAVLNTDDLADRYHELHRRKEVFSKRDIQEECRWKEKREGELFELFRSQHENASKSLGNHVLKTYAQQRASLELFTQWRLFLPTKGLQEHANQLLQQQGFYFNWELSSSLTLTLFPDGWKFTLPEATITTTERAQLVDQCGVPQLEVFYRFSVVGGSNNSYVQAVH